LAHSTIYSENKHCRSEIDAKSGKKNRGEEKCQKKEENRGIGKWWRFVGKRERREVEGRGSLGKEGDGQSKENI